MEVSRCLEKKRRNETEEKHLIKFPSVIVIFYLLINRKESCRSTSRTNRDSEMVGEMSNEMH